MPEHPTDGWRARLDPKGFVQNLLPRTLLGFAALVFFMGISAAFSGAALFAYYRFELDETRSRVQEVASTISDDLTSAQQILAADTDAATEEIDALLDELEQFAATGKSITELLEETRDSLFLITTLDADGQPSVGTAFVLFSDSEASFLLTSYTTIEAATVEPGPGIEARQGGERLSVKLNGWDEERDLALLVAEDAPNLPALEIGNASALDPGDRIFAVSALGARGGAIVQGFVADVASNAIQHDAPIGVQFQGGPMLNARGQVVGVGSRSYSPLGFVPDTVYFGVPILGACAQVVQCPSSLTGS